ncbi:IMP biosynthesis enzyme PurP domain protein [Pyrobaculum neutrophilum V24Sta]|uniref:5-formaminoimidazole-4-carboxamide-1-(beta)-D-ribofuranosyl 5'-monophosphate synthetase n=1 Tax=Pyrobaculum neutrophilum (strain DSM 2338 / JCM 9278 / NBRC 100436 / V24Sta) TaxID=444157 RepID=PURP_PYRNV|nr:RecName: Full=5-formaminoimidazole-4-carboxamide-1-(beta)-D-ribofuranosyl 5'-monophosphate synthetase; AltName: Full=5-aminoimidazole-4-carboxamide-1-beta-D-ribofuranosyl 5'-monophosphate--formate ligase [Pyrobaculum neutrophilum V24Sta]ACB40834.1 IMP biosynthesis enzyme PurP domain protein [Pyrobaculum neutrophilum V24Sta]
MLISGANPTHVSAALKRYDVEKLAVATVASHTALQILRGAKRFGFRTIAVAGRADAAEFYRQFGFIDEVWTADFRNFVKTAEKLVEANAVLVPHGSYVEYVGWRQALEAPVPTLGCRELIRWEADQYKKMELLQRAGVPTPRVYKTPEEVDRPVIVKLFGAKGGRGYFLARDREELRRRLAGLGEYIIQEYVFGVPAYYHFFSSPVYGRVEVFGADIRYESNVDGRTFGWVEPTFVVVGNLPLVLRESLLPTIWKYGVQFAKAVEEAVGCRLAGPYCLESIIRDDMSISVFEFSGRIVAGTNIYMGYGSPYSVLYFDRPMDMGERIAHEIREAARRGRLEDLFT